MTDFDLTPPALPNSKKKEGGFLKKFFTKDETPIPVPLPTSPIEQAVPLPVAPTPQEFDLDDIKRKLGLNEEDDAPAMAAPVATPEPLQERVKVRVDDWTADEARIVPETRDISQEKREELVVDSTPSNWSAPTEEAETKEPGAHHEAVETHLAVLDKQQEKILATIQKAADDKPQLPEWKLQEKEVPPEQYFVLKNGQPVRSLRELIDILDYIDDATFDHHVNEFRNDFANWIRDAIKDDELADEVQHAEDKPGVIRALLSHERSKAKEVVKEQENLQLVVKKRQDTLKKLGTVEEQIDALQKELTEKTKELTGERKRSSKLIKDKLDEEIERRLKKEEQAMIAARKELNVAKKTYLDKAGEYEHLVTSLASRERDAAAREAKAKEATEQAKQERFKLAEEKKNAAQLLKDAEHLKKEFEENKKLHLQTQQNLNAITKQETDLSRREETLRQREKKVTADLTRTHDEQERLKQLSAAHLTREAAVKKMEVESRKFMAEAETRTKEALDTERSSKDNIKAEMKKLQDLRLQIDKVLAKALGQKAKMTKAVDLRKHLEQAVGTMKTEIIQEREQLEREGYKSFADYKNETTPVGQPGSSDAEDVLRMGRNLPIYQKVTECRQALERKDMESARKLYNELREEFTQAKLDTSERSALYNSIRELYDDIHLAMLG